MTESDPDLTVLYNISIFKRPPSSYFGHYMDNHVLKTLMLLAIAKILLS